MYPLTQSPPLRKLRHYYTQKLMQNSPVLVLDNCCITCYNIGKQDNEAEH